MVPRTYNPRTWESGARGTPKNQGQPRLQNEIPSKRKGREMGGQERKLNRVRQTSSPFKKPHSLDSNLGLSHIARNSFLLFVFAFSTATATTVKGQKNTDFMPGLG